jgi:nucleoside-diphosphate-sugar epimerase
LHGKLAEAGGRVFPLPAPEPDAVAFERMRHAVSECDGRCDIVFASGLTDLARGATALDEANAAAPLRLIKATREWPTVRYLTIGTALEHVPAIAESNPYVASKRRLATGITDLLPVSRRLHVRLHTVYGGRPAPHMFLGQIAKALSDGSIFRMSDGTQWREYHHADDIAGSLTRLLAGTWDFPAGFTLNSGQPLQLRTVAEAAFAHFSTLDRLHVGALTMPDGEQLRPQYLPSPDEILKPSRPSLPGILAWISEQIGKPLT